MKKTIILLFVFALLISCKKPETIKIDNPLVMKDGLLYSDSLSTVPFTGRNKSRALDQFVEYDVVDGLKEGDFITYYSNNKVQLAGRMKGNKNVGEWKYYYPDGTLETSGFFDNDTASGKWIWFNQKGQILEEGNFLSGRREGEWKSYDSAGSVSVIKVYKNDEVIDSSKVN